MTETATSLKRAALACGHWADVPDDGTIPCTWTCPEHRKQVKVLVLWPLDADGNRVHSLGPADLTPGDPAS